ncbi:mycothiol transferase [Pseudonocardia bannensis]|uniref:DUF664 domain-containing protein n=1 Tax=Pseudonocardia bannensis TaxID=630973 RepID=A0A848DIY8_9PSEU|nr:DUF664 domain-containing protein [Pseudonocardia bannensis]NMH92672.1 DUF664 domain-containing protein [Pseudonocardia bannensis]
MTPAELLADAFTRIRDGVHGAVEGLTPDQLVQRIDDRANTIAWLVWHLTRVQDDHIAAVAGTEQVWTSQGWARRFGLPFDDSATGYGQSPDEVAAVRVERPDLLTGYHDAVAEQTLRYVRGLADADLDRVVDEAWDPPVTLGVRLVSVVSDDLQHVGQAGFVRGIVHRR